MISVWEREPPMSLVSITMLIWEVLMDRSGGRRSVGVQRGMEQATRRERF